MPREANLADGAHAAIAKFSESVAERGATSTERLICDEEAESRERGGGHDCWVVRCDWMRLRGGAAFFGS